MKLKKKKKEKRQDNHKSYHMGPELRDGCIIEDDELFPKRH